MHFLKNILPWLVEAVRHVPAPVESPKEPGMKTSLRGALEIMSHEAIVTSRYRDSKNVWTIGVGVTKSAGDVIDPTRFTGEISVQDAVAMFRRLLPKYEAIVDRLLDGRKVLQHEYDALVSLAWNAGNIDKGRQTRALVKQGRIADAINLWRFDKSLWPRRNKEAKLAETGRYTADYVTVYPASDLGAVLWRKGRRVPLVEFTGGGGGW